MSCCPANGVISKSVPAVDEIVLPLMLILSTVNAVTPVIAPATATVSFVRVIILVSVAIPIRPFPPESTRIVEFPNPVPPVPSKITIALSVLAPGTVIAGS